MATETQGYGEKPLMHIHGLGFGSASFYLGGKKLLLFVDFLRIKERVGMFHPLAVFPTHVKTAAVAGMARSRAILFDLDYNRVRIAVSKNFDDVLGITRFLAFHPVLVAGAAVKPGLAIAQRVGQGFLVHKSNHQYFTIFMVLNNRGNQAAHLVKINLNHSC